MTQTLNYPHLPRSKSIHFTAPRLPQGGWRAYRQGLVAGTGLLAISLAGVAAGYATIGFLIAP